MELPFGLGEDLDEPLPTPRPANVLLRFRYAFPLDPSMTSVSGSDEIDGADRMRTENGQELCFAGALLILCCFCIRFAFSYGNILACRTKNLGGFGRSRSINWGRCYES